MVTSEAISSRMPRSGARVRVCGPRAVRSLIVLRDSLWQSFELMKVPVLQGVWRSVLVLAPLAALSQVRLGHTL
jgi:hypothetical protein